MSDYAFSGLVYRVPANSLRELMLQILCDYHNFDPYVVGQILTAEGAKVIKPDPRYKSDLMRAQQMYDISVRQDDASWQKMLDVEKSESSQNARDFLFRRQDQFGLTNVDRREVISKLITDLRNVQPQANGLNDLWHSAEEILERANTALSSSASLEGHFDSLESFRQARLELEERILNQCKSKFDEAESEAATATILLHTLLSTLPNE